MQEGRNIEDMQKFDYLSYAVLPDPGRSEEQRHLRAGSHYMSEYGHGATAAPAKLVFYAHCEVEPLRALRLLLTMCPMSPLAYATWGHSSILASTAKLLRSMPVPEEY